MSLDTPDSSRDASNRLRTRFLIGAVLLAIVVRLLPWVLRALGVQLDERVSSYPWNFSPATAVCLFGAAYARIAGRSLLVPLAIGLVSDLGIGLLAGRMDYAIYPALPFVYAGHLVSTGFGLLFLRASRGFRSRMLYVLGTGVLAETTFFLISNFGVWWAGTTYPHTMGGLWACYVAGLPYRRNAMLGTLFYAPVLFASYAWLESVVAGPAGRPSSAEASS